MQEGAKSTSSLSSPSLPLSLHSSPPFPSLLSCPLCRFLSDALNTARGRRERCKLPQWGLGLSKIKSAARLVFSSSKYEDITPLLRQLHRLKAAERIDYKLAVLVYKCRQGVAPSYLADELCQPADTEARRRLHSTSSSSPIVRRTRLSTIGDRAFPVAARRVWNGLPQHVTSSPSLAVFRSHLKTHLFRRCFP